MSAKPKEVIMDIDRILKQTVDKDNKVNNVTAFNRSTGIRESLNENLIPEQLFDDPNTKQKEAQGISAVKALQIAQEQGQIIYTITKENYAKILPKLNHSLDVMTDVRNAINAGKEVTISQTQVHAFGWHGTGYIVLDPTTGTGVYLIGGGVDGGFLNFFGENANPFALALGAVSVLATLGSVSLPITIAILSISFFVGIMVTLATNLTLIENNCPDTTIIMNSVLNFIGFTLGVFLKGTGTAIVTAFSSWLYNNILPSVAPLCKYK
ncbi:hypothetical protein MOMA_02210 [Moraxella macacae 0408225]|uniref:Uncharacterized protein n=2 Tax=Moraxella macacae TaxID=765840 RepID=L2F9P2_9GAMM|nr:hypothetical protein MOMA_02210 [Moraxella macacae 0408225]